MQQSLAFSRQIAALATPELSAAENDALSLIITTLFNDLDSGHSCTILTEKISNLNLSQQINLLIKSKLTNLYSGCPTKLNPVPISIVNAGNKMLVYITKYLQYELDILHKIKLLSSHQADVIESQSQRHNIHEQNSLEELSAKFAIPNKEQYLAITNCIKHQFSIITGGPGTGKTTTVTLLLWQLYQKYGPQIKIKVCAPTGKASKRVQDAIQNSINNPNLAGLDFANVLNLLENRNNFLTIHKLLGYQKNNIYFKHNKTNLLDLDVLIIDESSMVSLPLFSKLFQAIDENVIKHVILLGDQNQLSSVEEGYVFASMVNAPNIKNHVSSLITSNRSNQDVTSLAASVNAENITSFGKIINDSEYIKSYKAKVSDLFDKQLFSDTNFSLRHYFKYISNSDLSDSRQLFVEFNRQVVLCLTNVGIFGSQYLNRQIEKKVKFIMANLHAENYSLSYDLFSLTQQFDISQYNNEWYTGRPIIILENDYSLELFNGDIGICTVTDGKALIIFENGRKFIPEVLPKYELAYAITIHKSQGSEYDHVNLMLCDNSGIQSMSSLLSKELIYTAITRAKTSISIFAGDKILPYAICNKTIRNTGLYLMLQ